MEKLIRMTALALCFALIFAALCGCSGGGEDETAAPVTQAVLPARDTEVLRLPYSKADTLDPFHAQSMINRQLTALIYDSLFTVGDGYEPEPLIARSVTQDDLTLTVALKSGLVFSDGSALTSRDVVYSFDKALASPVYSSRLAAFASASASGGDTVVFKLASPDIFAVSCLTFAVVKYGTADDYEERDEDREYREATDDIPVGGGRYIPKAQNGDITLNAFGDRLGGFSPKITEIALVDCPNSESMPYTLEIGEISFFFNNLSDGNYRRISASIAEIPMNNLVYLGINSAHAALAEPAVRGALAKLIDREHIALDCYAGHAAASWAPFNPAWSRAARLEAATPTDSAAALELLEDKGYTRVSDYGVRYRGATGASLRFDMLVCEGSGFRSAAAEYIKNALGELNISVVIEELEYEEYAAAVTAGKFDLYIGEVRLSANMSLSPFFSEGGGASYGITPTQRLESAYAEFLSGEAEISEFAEVFAGYMPFVPLCWRTGMCCCTRTMAAEMNSCDGDVYRDIENWTFLTE